MFIFFLKKKSFFSIFLCSRLYTYRVRQIDINRISTAKTLSWRHCCAEENHRCFKRLSAEFTVRSLYASRRVSRKNKNSKIRNGKPRGIGKIRYVGRALTARKIPLYRNKSNRSVTSRGFQTADVVRSLYWYFRCTASPVVTRNLTNERTRYTVMKSNVLRRVFYTRNRHFWTLWINERQYNIYDNSGRAYVFFFFRNCKDCTRGNINFWTQSGNSLSRRCIFRILAPGRLH